MESLRSVITQATRGGRLVASRRNFSSSSVPKETNEIEWRGERVIKESYSAFLQMCGGALIGFALLHDIVEETEGIKKRTEEYQREVETLQS